MEGFQKVLGLHAELQGLMDEAISREARGASHSKEDAVLEFVRRNPTYRFAAANGANIFIFERGGDFLFHVEIVGARGGEHVPGSPGRVVVRTLGMTADMALALEMTGSHGAPKA